MSFTHRIKRGSTRPVLRYPLPSGVDLTGASAVLIMSPRPGQPAVVNSPATIVDGVVEYEWQHGDTLQDGTFYAEIEVTYPGGAVETFPAQGYFAVVIDKDLGDGGVIVPSVIQMSAAMAEAGADTAAGSMSVGISLSGALAEAGNDTATGDLSVVAPGAITLTAALVEAGADTASGAASVGITASAAMVEAGADTAAGDMTVEPLPDPITAQRVIVLTDYAGDCDDAMALGVACAAHKAGDIDILGVIATSTIGTSAAGVYGQLRAYGMEDVPVYAYRGTTGVYNNQISGPVRDAFGVPGQTRDAYLDDVTGLRRLLAAAPDASVKVIDVGAPISTARLLDSPADDISPMTGLQLAAAKVSGLWQMAGDFTLSRAEYNATRHIPSTQRVYHDWPTPVYALDYPTGDTVYTGPPAGADPAVDPIKVAFDAAAGGGYLNAAGKRSSWDPMAVHHAIYGDGLWYTTERGSIAVDASGYTTWTADPSGSRYRIGKAATDAAIGAEIDRVAYSVDLPVPVAPYVPPAPAPARVVTTATNYRASPPAGTRTMTIEIDLLDSEIIPNGQNRVLFDLYGKINVKMLGWGGGNSMNVSAATATGSPWNGASTNINIPLGYDLSSGHTWRIVIGETEFQVLRGGEFIYRNRIIPADLPSGRTMNLFNATTIARVKSARIWLTATADGSLPDAPPTYSFIATNDPPQSANLTLVGSTPELYTPPAQTAPAFTTQPSLTGSTALGSTITVDLGTASGTPAPTLTGALTRPGKAAATVADGDTFVIEAADQGGTITLDVTATNSAGSATASASLAVPAADPFPAIAGEFMHYRQEDVSSTGVVAAHGQPLHMDLVGTLNRIKVGNADYMDCTAGALDVVREPWPAGTPFTLWFITGGGRVTADCFYNGPELFTTSDATLTFRGNGQVTAGGYVGTWSLPAAAGPETFAYHCLGAGRINAAFTARHNGTSLGAPAVAQNPNVQSTGSTFVIGGKRKPDGTVQFAPSFRWRDVVLLIGRDFTASEIAALEAYAAKRIAGTA